jgi:iron complex outermembrane receptor protein
MTSRILNVKQEQRNAKPMRRRLIAIAVSATISGGAWAAEGDATAKAPADAGDKAGIVLKKVVVTAERREDDVQAIASAVTVISGDTIESSEVRNAGDIIRFVPNMTADTTDGHGRPKFYIRGIGLSDASVWNTNPIGTYIDDVYIWNASTVGFPLFDLERVEVLRGPQGTLWGKNTTGGAINFISKKPTFDTDGYAKLSYGNYHNKVFEGAVGGAIKDDVLAARVSIHREDSDLYSQNSFVPGTERWSDLGVRTQVLAKFSSTFDALLNLHYRDFNGPVLQSGTTAVPTQTRFDVPSLVDPTDNLKQKGASLTFNKKLDGGVTLTSITGYENFDRLQTSADSVTYESSRSRTDFSVKQLSQEFRLASSKANKLSWITGTYLFDGKLDFSSQTGVLPGSLTATGTAKARSYNTTDYALKSKSYALFGNVDYKFTEQFDVAVGLRQTWETKDINYLYRTAPAGVAYNNVAQWWLPGSLNSALTTAATQNESKTWSALTYDITPTYQFTDTLRAYFRHAKGFNGGNFNAGATAQSQVTTIAPEYLKSYELGVKSEWWDNRLQINAAAFYYDYTDIQQKATALNPLNPSQQVLTFINARRGTVKGIDLEIAVVPVRDLRVAVNIGLNNTRFDDFQDTPTHNSAGNSFNRVPQVISNIQVDYKYPLATGAALLFNTDWAYRSKAYFNAVDQTSDYLVENAYWLGNLSAGYVSPDKKYEVRGYVLNVTDKVYRNTALITGLYSYGAPRTFGVSATYRF